MQNRSSPLLSILMNENKSGANQFFSRMPTGVLTQINRLIANYYVIRDDEYLLALVYDLDAKQKVQQELVNGHHLYLVLERNGSKDQVGDIYTKSGELLYRLGTRKVIRYFYQKNYGLDGENILPESDINRVLHYIALGNPTKALQMLKANRRLLEQSGYVIAQTGDLLWNVKPLECALSLGEHESDMIPAMLPLFDLLNGGEEEKQKQQARYDDAIDSIGTELRYNFEWIMNVIKQSPATDVTAALAKDFTQESYLRDSLMAFRNHFPMRVITNGLVCSYAMIEEVLKMYDGHKDAFRGALDNADNTQDRSRLLWRQVVGFIYRRRATDRQALATGQLLDDVTARLSRTYEFRHEPGQSFEPCQDFLADDDEALCAGSGWDSSVDVNGRSREECSGPTWQAAWGIFYKHKQSTFMEIFSRCNNSKTHSM